MSSDDSKEITGDETIARFLRQSSYVAKSTGRIKHTAFLPAPDNDTSVFFVDGLTNDGISELAQAHVNERSKNGTALFQSKAIAEADLTLKSSEPPPRHANITKWSMNLSIPLRKAERKAAAMILAEESTWLPAQQP